MIYGLEHKPDRVPEIPLDRPKPPKEPKATLVKKVDMGSGDEAEASKSKKKAASATTTLLAANAAETVAMANTPQAVYRQLYDRWKCEELTCPNYNKQGGGCWVLKDEHYSLALRDIQVWARKIVDKIDNCNIEEPYQQLRHQLIEQALKDARRKATQREKREKRSEPTSSSSTPAAPLALNPYLYYPLPPPPY